jgi:NitT/TauT family transport system permease protein
MSSQSIKVQACRIEGDGSSAVLVCRILLVVLLVGLWDFAGRYIGSNWISSPGRIAQRLYAGFQGDLLTHLLLTLRQLFIGFGLGANAGIAIGLVLGRTANLTKILRPFIVAGYALPLSTLAPLLILWFGLDMTPKIVLVSVTVFFLILFTTMSGVQSIDEDLVVTLRLMGASNRELFTKVLAPASVAWILSGTKIALPFALVSVTTAEMLAGRGGLGSLITTASTQFDMTGIYTILVILMALGIILASGANWLDRRLLRWRNARN